MAVTARIEEGFKRLQAGDLENALIQACIGIDAAAKELYGGKPGERFKRFIGDHKELIYFITLGCGPQFAFGESADFRWGSKGDLPQVLYMCVRNSLLHEGDASLHVVYGTEAMLGLHDNDRFYVCKELILGLLLAVAIRISVNAPPPSGKWTIQTGGNTFELNDIWRNPGKLYATINFKPRTRTESL